jgi:calmodulin|eukprot:SAG25_NODE_227_length_11484_cov_21.485684_1_plen_526_part_00
MHERPRPGRGIQATVSPQSRQVRGSPGWGRDTGDAPPPHQPKKVWRSQPRYRTAAELWHGRWQSKQPHPSFDIDGDGIISNHDYYLASQYDQDNNGVLDPVEAKRMRAALTKQGLAAFHKAGGHGKHGPHIKKMQDDLQGRIMRATRDEGTLETIDPDAPGWHVAMDKLTGQTRTAHNRSSHEIVDLLAHNNINAAPVGMQGISKGIHQLMGSGWRDESAHADVYDAAAGGWVDKKEGPVQLRDQDQGARRRRSNPILEAVADHEVVEDADATRMHQAGKRIMREQRVLAGESAVAQAKVGKLAKADTQSLRRLFEQLDKDRSGTLNADEVLHLAAAGGRRLSKRQVKNAMAEMDVDGSGEVDFDEFERWWDNGVIHPAQGTDVFRRVTAQLDCRFANYRDVFRKFDENKDGTLDQREFRNGLLNCGVELTDAEFRELMTTLDEDGTNEIDYPEFASSAVAGGKYFSARDPAGCSGFRTRKLMHAHRKRVERAFGQHQMDSFWSRNKRDPSIAVGAITRAGGGGM